MKLDISLFLCNQESRIKDAMKVIDNNARGVAFIVDKRNRLVGIITDGDIRRILLNGYGLNDNLKDHMRREYKFANVSTPLNELKQLFSQRVTIVPLVDDYGQVVDYVEYDKNQRIVVAQPQMSGNEYQYLMDAFLSTWISSKGEYVTRFEDSFSKFCGVRYGVATSNGTTALHLALVTLGIGPDDEVIVPDLTFAATINAVIYTGATPVIVDIEETSWCMSPQAFEAAITSKTKAVIPVHIYGQPCDMGAICDIAKKHNLYIVEDCAEAHGAEWATQKVGSFGIISCFSFFGNKVITTGEGGMCLTNDENFKNKMMHYRDHGMSSRKRYYHDVVGFNYRMTNLQAAIGVAQVERIDEILKWRNSIEDSYYSFLGNIGGIETQHRNLSNRKKIAWLVSILVDASKREGIVKALEAGGVDARLFFTPLSKMEIYSRYAVDCSVSHNIAERGLNLPTTYDISDKNIKKIASIIEENV